MNLHTEPTITLSANTSWYLFNFRASTIRALVNAGHRVVCLSPSDDYAQRLHELGAEWRSLPMDNAGSHPLRDLGLLLRLWRHYRQLRPLAAFQFTIKNNMYGTWAARALGIPALNNVSGLGTAFIRQGWVGVVVRTLYRLSQPLAHRVFCQNIEDHALLLQQGLVPADKLVLLPGSGVDLKRFHPRLNQVRAAGEPLRLLYAGRMLADKGLQELIEAVTQINVSGVRCTLSLCGFAGAQNVSAIDETTLQAWAQRPGIFWLGPSDDMPSVYARADVVVLPSYREGMPHSLLEAGAMGLPAITTDVPGCRHIIEHGNNGLLCEVKNSQALQAAIEQMLDMRDEDRTRMGTNARQIVESQFDEQLVVQAALDAVLEIEQRKNRR